MFIEIGSYDAKTKLPEMLRRVEAGESFTITNRGKPVADLILSHEVSCIKAKAAIENILKAHKPKISSEKLAELKARGRR